MAKPGLITQSEKASGNSPFGAPGQAPPTGQAPGSNPFGATGQAPPTGQAPGSNPFGATGQAPPTGQAPGQAPPTGQVKSTGSVFGQGKDVGPEIQQVYDSAMEMVSELLHVNQQSADGILTFIDEANTPQEGVAEATDLVMSKLEEAFEGQLPAEIILHLVEEITDLLIEQVAAAGIAEVTGEFVDQAKILSSLKIMEEYGVEQQDFESVAANVAPEDIMGIESILTGDKGGGTT